MDFITKLFDMDLSALVPEMPVFLGSIRTILILALLVGPVVLLVLGAMYLIKPAPEANFKYGFRTYFGMGSVEAWKYSQKIAGIAYGVSGVLLLIAMFVVILNFGGKDLMQISGIVIFCLLCQSALALLARWIVAILAWFYFDKDGNRRQ